MADEDDFSPRDAGAIKFGWWKTNEHFSAPGSKPEAVSRSRDLVEDDLRERTDEYGGSVGWPVIAVDFGRGWQYAYRAQTTRLVDVREESPGQPSKYQGVRDEKTSNRGGLREMPPRDELDITPRDLDVSGLFPSSVDESESDLAAAISVGDEIERRYAERIVNQRLHQPEIRRLTLAHYGTACTYCGQDVPEIVEAAHLIADSEGGAASVENMRPMCPNHHRAYDAGLLVWDGDRFGPADGAPPVGPAPGTA
ncbi:HNH endonuclease [Gordonia alkaliphila]|uniref:HNH endonuclease signature motif containing protein n=1 Tax=Gordonia alkaliphila TaxID=1053547 RepID=UPI001FF356E1|nr:HNH endonuclease signature motif containing protein [Gordonia alkaliphila]MCK0441290.1 HNH endonuclease [Gordonia alkaliphila]